MIHDLALWLAHGGYVAALRAHALLIGFLAVWRWSELRPALTSDTPDTRDATRRVVVPLALALCIGAVAAALRWSLPASPQVIYDEFWYLSIARHMREAGDATPSIVRDASGMAPPGETFRPPYPQGWPWLETWAGGTPPWRGAVDLERGVGVLASMALFGALAGESLWGATFAGLGLAVLPAFVRLGQGASAEGASALFVIVALWAALSQRRRPGPAGQLLALATLAWALHFRPENGLYVVLFTPLLIGATIGRAREEGPHEAAAEAPVDSGRADGNTSVLALLLRGTTVLIVGLLAAADAIIMIDGATGPYRDDHFVAQPRPGFSTWQANMAANLIENTLFFVDGRVMPAWLTAAAALGVVMLVRERRVGRLTFLLAWMGLFTLALSPFPFGDFAAAHSIDTWRFSIQVSLPMLVLGAHGLDAAMRVLGRGPATATAAGLALWMGLSTAAYGPFMTAARPQSATWDDLARVASTVDGRVAVNDDSIAVALREGFAVDVVAWTKDADPGTPWLLMVESSDAPAAWRGLPLDLIWTTGPVEAGREGLTLHRRAAPTPSNEATTLHPARGEAASMRHHP